MHLNHYPQNGLCFDLKLIYFSLNVTIFILNLRNFNLTLTCFHLKLSNIDMNLRYIEESLTCLNLNLSTLNLCLAYCNLNLKGVEITPTRNSLYRKLGENRCITLAAIAKSKNGQKFPLQSQINWEGTGSPWRAYTMNQITLQPST